MRSISTLADLKIQIFADGADMAEMIGLAHHPLIKGFTTNPSLLLKAGVTDYERFAKDLITRLPDYKSISFEVLADDLYGMQRQARKIASWGPNVYVKIPVMTTARQTTRMAVQELLSEGVRVNVTGITSARQVAEYREALGKGDLILSIFAGRIADTGRYAPSQVGMCRVMCPDNVRILWASPRELYNVFEAEKEGADIITLPMSLIQKFDLIGKDLDAYSRETVAQFYADGQKAKLYL